MIVTRISYEELDSHSGNWQKREIGYSQKTPEQVLSELNGSCNIISYRGIPLNKDPDGGLVIEQVHIPEQITPPEERTGQNLREEYEKSMGYVLNGGLRGALYHSTKKKFEGDEKEIFEEMGRAIGLDNIGSIINEQIRLANVQSQRVA
jgi:hypothetical protein